MTNTLYRHPTSLRLSDADIPHRQRPRSADRSRQRRRRRVQRHGARRRHRLELLLICALYHARNRRLYTGATANTTFPSVSQPIPAAMRRFIEAVPGVRHKNSFFRHM